MTSEEIERPVIKEFGEPSAPDLGPICAGDFSSAAKAACQTRSAVKFAPPQYVPVDAQCPRCGALLGGDGERLKVDPESLTATCICSQCRLFINVDFECENILDASWIYVTLRPVFES